jgi:methionine-rich copper-binding protein CopC
MRKIVLAVAGLFAAGSASAHALLVRAAPAVGATVSAPADVAIVFSEAVEPAFSSITVQDAAGARVDLGQAHVVDGDAHRLAVGLKPLPPGTYAVTWKATSVDTHKTQGRFRFTVKP